MDESAKQKKFIEQLITALKESEEVRQTILSMIDVNKNTIPNNDNIGLNAYSEKLELLRNENDNLISKNKSLEQELNEAVNKIEALNHTLLEKERIISAHDNKTEELNSQIKALQDELLQYERSIGDYNLLYGKYLELSASTKDRLSNIICSDNLIGFIVSCSDFKNLECLWDYNKSLIMSGSESNELTVLKEVFDVFFKEYNSSSKNPRYVYDDTKEDDTFDDDFHIKAKNSRVQGKISAVLLRGYKSAVTNNQIRKSVVMV